MNISTVKLPAIAIAFVATSAMTLPAQNSGHDSHHNNKNGSHHSEKDHHKTGKSAKSKHNSQAADYRIEPQGWITVASDYNDDGYYDSIETIYYYDFEKARDASKQRQGSDKKSSAQQSRSQSNQKQAARRASVQGEITSLKTMEPDGKRGKQLVAKIETSNGRTAHVCLGPKNKLSKLKLSNGDTVSAQGVVMKKDGKPVMLASEVTSDGESVTHKLTKRPAIKRLEGKIDGLQQTESKRGDGMYLVANVKTDNGTTQVHLGQKKQLKSLNLSEGDDVKMLVRTGKVSGKSCPVALQVWANDKTVKVMPPKQASKKRKADRDNR